MKRKSTLLLNWILVLGLFSVLLGNSVSLHIERESQHFSSLKFEKSPPVQDQDEDSCAQGYCHLGLCANLLLPEANTFYLLLDLPTQYSLKSDFIPEPNLDTPFQPPRWT